MYLGMIAGRRSIPLWEGHPCPDTDYGGRAMNGISIALAIHSLDYYYKPTSAIWIDELNSYPYSIEKFLNELD